MSRSPEISREALTLIGVAALVTVSLLPLTFGLPLYPLTLKLSILVSFFLGALTIAVLYPPKDSAPAPAISEAKSETLPPPSPDTPDCSNHHLNNQRTVAVAEDYFWNEMDSCPRGVKVQLLGQGGVAVYGLYDGKSTFWQGWAPIPQRRKPA